MDIFDSVDISQYLNQGVLLLGNNGVVLGWNNWLVERSGKKIDDVVGQQLLEIYPELQGRPSFSRLMSSFKNKMAVVLSPAIHQYLLPIPASATQKSHGVDKMFQLVQGQIINLPDSQDLALLVYIIDVTENYLLNKKIQGNFQEIQEKNEQLDEARKHSSSFLANMSHELRTPLNSILVLSQLLSENKNGNLNESDIEFANTINRSGKGLLSLINDVLDLAKVEAGRLDVVLETFSLNELLKSEKDIFKPMAMDKNAKFSIEVEEGVEDYFYGDSHRMSQILRNFLSNAFKFAINGNIILRVERRKNWLNFVDAVSFSVIDDGIGIPQDKLSEIFEPFKQVDGTISRQYGGTGLGLSICRDLAELLGGKVLVESEVGRGSIFTLALPFKTTSIDQSIKNTKNKLIDKVEDTQKADIDNKKDISVIEGVPSKSSDIIDNLNAKKILYVDSSIRDIYIMTAALEDLSMSVSMASTGSEAIDKLKVDGGDIMLMNTCDEHSYFKTIKNIRAAEEYFRLPIFVFCELEEDVEKFKEIGADEVFVKPVNLDLLSRLMAQYLKPRHCR